ncbi:chemosensory protein A 87a [Arctopsyche grandis]|uniref:chemosensory protein A 87a n=1 Tax=Arctopsyche grandis TaxID=121162 RepID=UPI00406D6FC2
MGIKHDYIYAIFAIWSIIPNLPENNAQFIGPVLITLKRFEKCGEDAEGVKFEFGMRKLNRTHTGVDAFIEFPYEFGNEIQFSATASKWGDGGWKPHILDIYDTSTCNFFMKYAEDKFKELLIQNNVEPVCPVPKGTYSMKDYIFDGELSKPIMFGEFMVDVFFIRNGVQLTCIKLFLRSDPKNEGKPF